MATLGLTKWGNDSAAWDMAKELQARGVDADLSISMVERMLASNATAQLAVKGALNPPAGIVNDVTVDRTVLLRQVDEELPNGLRRTLREAEYRDIVRLTSDARNAK